MNVTEMENSQLRDELMKYGVDAAVAGSTRKLYEKKLQRLMAGGEPRYEEEVDGADYEDNDEEEEEEEETIPVPVQAARKRQTVTTTTKTTLRTTESPIRPAKVVTTAASPVRSGAEGQQSKSGMSLWVKLFILFVIGAIIYFLIQFFDSEDSDNPIPKLQ